MSFIERCIELTSHHQTDNKLVWSARVKNASLTLYIPKWRVPEPWPGKITVFLTDDLSSWNGYTPLKIRQVLDSPSLAERKIIAPVFYTRSHTETFRLSFRLNF